MWTDAFHPGEFPGKRKNVVFLFYHGNSKCVTLKSFSRSTKVFFPRHRPPVALLLAAGAAAPYRKRSAPRAETREHALHGVDRRPVLERGSTQRGSTCIPAVKVLEGAPQP